MGYMLSGDHKSYLSMNQTVLLGALLLLCTVTAVNIDQNNVQEANDDKVKVNLYFESLCPGCHQFIMGALKTAANTKDFWKICNFTAYPYGNARRFKNGTTWGFNCQHGVRECEGNLIETCALNLYDKDTKFIPFLICLEGNTNDWTSQGKRCASQYGMDWDKINSCAKGQQGIDWLVEVAQETENLQPAHTYVPWITVNGAHTREGESGVESNMVKYVCNLYKGPEKIAACGH